MAGKASRKDLLFIPQTSTYVLLPSATEQMARGNRLMRTLSKLEDSLLPANDKSVASIHTHLP